MTTTTLTSYEFAMAATRQAEGWALSYSTDDKLKWQAEWAAQNARNAWAAHQAGKE